MLLLGGILLAVFVVPWPWGILAVLAGGLLDIGESFAFLRWSRRRKSPVGAEALVGQTAVVVTTTQVRVAGELWAARSDDPLRIGGEVEVTAVDGLTLSVRDLRPEGAGPEGVSPS
jgi:membrane protein implicated in regulation of membrane protease activity